MATRQDQLYQTYKTIFPVTMEEFSSVLATCESPSSLQLALLEYTSNRPVAEGEKEEEREAVADPEGSHSVDRTGATRPSFDSPLPRSNSYCGAVYVGDPVPAEGASGQGEGRESVSVSVHSTDAQGVEDSVHTSQSDSAYEKAGHAFPSPVDGLGESPPPHTHVVEETESESESDDAPPCRGVPSPSGAPPPVVTAESGAPPPPLVLDSLPPSAPVSVPVNAPAAGAYPCGGFYTDTDPETSSPLSAYGGQGEEGVVEWKGETGDRREVPREPVEDTLREEVEERETEGEPEAEGSLPVFPHFPSPPTPTVQREEAHEVEAPSGAVPGPDREIQVEYVAVPTSPPLPVYNVPQGGLETVGRDTDPTPPGVSTHTQTPYHAVEPMPKVVPMSPPPEAESVADSASDSESEEAPEPSTHSEDQSDTDTDPSQCEYPADDGASGLDQCVRVSVAYGSCLASAVGANGLCTEGVFSADTVAHPTSHPLSSSQTYGTGPRLAEMPCPTSLLQSQPVPTYREREAEGEREMGIEDLQPELDVDADTKPGPNPDIASGLASLHRLSGSLRQRVQSLNQSIGASVSNSNRVGRGRVSTVSHPTETHLSTPYSLPLDERDDKGASGYLPAASYTVDTADRPPHPLDTPIRLGSGVDRVGSNGGHHSYHSLSRHVPPRPTRAPPRRPSRPPPPPPASTAPYHAPSLPSLPSLPPLPCLTVRHGTTLDVMCAVSGGSGTLTVHRSRTGMAAPPMSRYTLPPSHTVSVTHPDGTVSDMDLTAFPISPSGVIRYTAVLDTPQSGVYSLSLRQREVGRAYSDRGMSGVGSSSSYHSSMSHLSHLSHGSSGAGMVGSQYSSYIPHHPSVPHVSPPTNGRVLSTVTVQVDNAFSASVSQDAYPSPSVVIGTTGDRVCMEGGRGGAPVTLSQLSVCPTPTLVYVTRPIPAGRVDSVTYRVEAMAEGSPSPPSPSSPYDTHDTGVMLGIGCGVPSPSPSHSGLSHVSIRCIPLSLSSLGLSSGVHCSGTAGTVHQPRYMRDLRLGDTVCLTLNRTASSSDDSLSLSVNGETVCLVHVALPLSCPVYPSIELFGPGVLVRLV
ncbi:hypothetical protein KIPB_007639 [Kipferlia bialata]|uniref:Uncharacterized protein n=1 Tax=Kipferlia bialata TaxID=797122 RepID=A0A9K3CYX2_9EUKA|nr:hypothetical protein KIPB_007639 [Kipferlia bialata]|eukprot:g7639.t1